MICICSEDFYAEKTLTISLAKSTLGRASRAESPSGGHGQEYIKQKVSCCQKKWNTNQTN